MHGLIPTAIVPSVEPAALSPRQVAQEFRRLLHSGARLCVAGEARDEPTTLLSAGYTPCYKIELFDTVYYLSKVRQNPDIRFFVAYVIPQRHARPRIYARIFYKDVSLIWRSASHTARSETENWIGKGDVTVVSADGYETVTSAEETTDLPLEIQTALEVLCRRQDRMPTDHKAVGLILRNGPDHRIEPYQDFSGPRRRAASNPRNRIYGGRRIAWFTRKGDPASLRIAAGFEPDWDGVIETAASNSTLYGGTLRRFRILSKNRRIQYLFFAGPRHAWIIPPQSTTTEIMSFGVRTIGVAIDDDLCVPGFEYHYMDYTEDPPVLVTQIPEGFVGEPSAVDPSRADASAWLDRLPVIRDFRETVLGVAQS